MHHSADHSPDRSTRRGGFTLVELLVVVAIIMALLSILLPSMSRAIASAQSTVCSSHVHQWSLAIQSYNADHFGAFPLYTSDVTPFQRMRKYWQTDEIKICPSAPSPYSTPTLNTFLMGGASHAFVESRYDTDGDGDLDFEIGGYAWNAMCNVRDAWPAMGGTPSIPSANYITHARHADARVPLWADGHWTAFFVGSSSGTFDTPDAYEPSPTQGSYSVGIPRIAIRRHIGKTINLGMADGHAERSTLPDLWVKYRWHANYQMGGPPPVIPWL